jgi:hypothetical protein
MDDFGKRSSQTCILTKKQKSKKNPTNDRIQSSELPHPPSSNHRPKQQIDQAQSSNDAPRNSSFRPVLGQTVRQSTARNLASEPSTCYEYQQ